MFRSYGTRTGYPSSRTTSCFNRTDIAPSRSSSYYNRTADIKDRILAVRSRTEPYVVVLRRMPVVLPSSITTSVRLYTTLHDAIKMQHDASTTPVR